jgi:hypothetical protein
MKKHLLFAITILGLTSIISIACIKKELTPSPDVATFSSVSSRFGASDTVEVDILAGQSNLGGYGLLAQLPAYLKDTLKGCWIYYPVSHNIEELIYNRNCVSFSGKHGVELSYSYRMKQLNGKERVLVKYGPGGTYLKDSTGIKDWNVNSTKEYYNTLKSYVTQAKNDLTAEGKIIKYKNFIWYQGEADAAEYAGSSLYSANLTALVNKVKSDFGSDINIVIVRTHNVFPYSNVVRSADSTLCANNGWYMVDTDMYNPSIVHLTSSDLVNLGNDLANLLYNK